MNVKAQLEFGQVCVQCELWPQEPGTLVFHRRSSWWQCRWCLLCRGRSLWSWCGRLCPTWGSPAGRGKCNTWNMKQSVYSTTLWTQVSHVGLWCSLPSDHDRRSWQNVGSLKQRRSQRRRNECGPPKKLFLLTNGKTAAETKKNMSSFTSDVSAVIRSFIR